MTDITNHTPGRGHRSAPLLSVGHALDVLEAFDLDHAEFGVTELSRRIGVAPSTIHRALVTLAAHRLVEPTRYRTYRLGVRAIEIGSLALQHRGFGGAIQPAIEELARAVNETVNVAILDGDDILYVAVLETTAVLRPHFAVGQRGPSDRTALGKVLLALTREVSDQPPHLRDELARVRVEQVAYDNEESEPGVRCVAVPIFDRRSARVVAALSVSGPGTRMDEEKLVGAIPHLRRAAAAIAPVIGVQLGTLLGRATTTAG